VPPQYGWTPWDTWPPFFLDTSAAEALDYRPAGSYAETVADQVTALLTMTPTERDRLDNDDYFQELFDYNADNDALAIAGIP